MFLVERIISHKGNTKFSSHLKFEVKWLGWETPTVEPWDHIRDSEQLHAYLREHKLQRLIPKK